MEQLIDGFLAMSNRDLWLAFVAIAIPILTSFIVAQSWSPMAKSAAFIILSILGAVGFIWAYDAFQTQDLPRLFLLLAMIGIVVYQLFKKPLGDLTARSDSALGRK